MKKIFLSWGICVLAAMAVWADPSAIDFRYAQVQWPGAEAVPAAGGDFVLRPILEGKTLVVSLWIDHEKQGEREYFASLIREGYNAWFEYTTKQIKEQGRETEFQDILKYIDRPIPVSVIAEGDADIKVRVWRDIRSLIMNCRGNPRAHGCYGHREMMLGKQLKDDDQKMTIIHEIGHSLGLADQRPYQMFAASLLYSSYQIHDEIMADAEELSCGDADGLINLIDITLQLQRPKGASWKSFCPQSIETFKNGISSYSNRYLFTSTGSQGLLLEYQNSEQIAEMIFDFTTQAVDPFYVPQKPVVLKRDEADRPAHLRGSQGEDIYNFYGQEQDVMGQIVVQNQEVIFGQRTLLVKVPSSGDKHIVLLREFGLGEGKSGLLTCEFGTTMRAAIYEEYIYGSREPYLKLQVKFNQNDRKKKISLLKNTGKSVLLTQFQPSSKDDIIDAQIKKADWEKRFIDWAENWPRYLGLLPAKNNKI